MHGVVYITYIETLCKKYPLLPPTLFSLAFFADVSHNFTRRNFVNSHDFSHIAVGVDNFDKFFTLSRYVKRRINICTPMYTA